MICTSCKHRKTMARKTICRRCWEESVGRYRSKGKPSAEDVLRHQLAHWCDECLAMGFHRPGCPTTGTPQSFRRAP